MRATDFGLLVGVALALQAAAPAAQAQTAHLEIDGTGGDGISLGQRQSTFFSVGQTFAVPWGFRTIDEFAFDLMGPGAGWTYEPMLFRAYVMRWDTAAGRPYGRTVYRSDPFEVVPDQMDISFHRVAFQPGTWVRPGAVYAAFLSTVEHPLPLSSERRTNLVFEVLGEGYEPYTGGRMVTAWSGPGLRSLVGSPNWDEAPDGVDMRFDATFSTTATPEPASLVLLGSGLAGLAGVARRRRRGRADP